MGSYNGHALPGIAASFPHSAVASQVPTQFSLSHHPSPNPQLPCIEQHPILHGFSVSQDSSCWATTLEEKIMKKESRSKKEYSDMD